MIIGHNKQLEFFQGLKNKETISHSFLFSGEEKLGKRLLAVEASMLLNCKANNKNEPCGVCDSCNQIEKGISADFFEINSSKEIKISEIRELIRKLSFKSSQKGFKFGIINNAHLMTIEAQNCFLKTLEEPKERTILFLITQYPDLLLQTILSRVFRMKFFPVEKSLIEKYLEERGISQEKIKDLIKLSFGRPGIIIDLLNSPEKEKEYKLAISEFEKTLFSSFLFRLQYAKENSENRIPEEVFENWISYFREKALSCESLVRLQEIKENMGLLFEAKISAMTTNVNRRLLFENLLINLK